MDKILVSSICVPCSRTLAVREDESLETAIKQFVKQPDVHNLFIVDERQKLKGLVKLHYILNWVKLKLGIDISKRPNTRLSGTSQAFEIMKLCQSQTIGDIISEAISVKENDTLEQALHLMVHNELVELPVVDKAGKLVGEVKLTQLLSQMLENTDNRESICQL